MEKRKELKLVLRVVLALSLFAIIISFARAEIIISQPKGVYSVGDELTLEFQLGSLKESYLDLNLICGTSSINLYHGVPEVTSFVTTRKLTKEYINDLLGTCRVSAIYGDEKKDSQNFELANIIDLSLNIQNLTHKAGDSIIIKGNAAKRNGQTLGQVYVSFVEASLNYRNETLSSGKVLTSNDFEVNFTTKETMHAGNYNVNIKVYDKDEKGNILNQGETYAQIALNQEAAKADLALDKLDINPGEDINLIPFLYDKAGDAFSSQVLIKATDNKGNVLYEGFVNANENFVLKTQTNTASGYANIIIQKEDITNEKSFNIREFKKISAKIENNSLVITNIGNIAYKRLIEVRIGNETILKEINLGLGEEVGFEILAPDGVYDVSIKDENTEFVQRGVSLTGNAISLRETGERAIDFVKDYPIVWVFILAVLVLLVYAMLRKHKEKKLRYGEIRKMDGGSFLGFKSFKSLNNLKANEVKETKSKGGVEIINREEMLNKVTMGEIREAEQVLVMHGSKSPASIISLKLKSEVNGEAANQNLAKALEYAYQKKAVSYMAGRNILLIFSPLITKNFKNEETAIRVAIDMDNFLRDFNRKFRNIEINYGIGVNSGEIVNRIESNKLKFNSIDKTINFTKKIAELANQEVLLSKEIHEKTMNNIKADKIVVAGMDLFKVKRVVDTEKSRQFINDFMKRN